MFEQPIQFCISLIHIGLQLFHDLFHLGNIIGNLLDCRIQLFDLHIILHAIDRLLHGFYIVVDGIFSVTCHITVIIHITTKRISKSFQLIGQKICIVGQVISQFFTLIGHIIDEITQTVQLIRELLAIISVIGRFLIRFQYTGNTADIFMPVNHTLISAVTKTAKLSSYDTTGRASQTLESNGSCISTIGDISG